MMNKKYWMLLIPIMCSGCLLGLDSEERDISGTAYEISREGKVLDVLSEVLVKACLGQPNIYYKCSTEDITDDNGKFDITLKSYSFNEDLFRLYKENYSLDSCVRQRDNVYNCYLKSDPSIFQLSLSESNLNIDSVAGKFSGGGSRALNEVFYASADTTRKTDNSLINDWTLVIPSPLQRNVDNKRFRSTFGIEVDFDSVIKFEYQTFKNGVLVFEEEGELTIRKGYFESLFIRQE